MKTQTAFGFALAILLTSCLEAAKKDRDWKTGKLTDSQTVNTGTVVHDPGVFAGPAPPLPTRAVTVTTAELQITGVDYSYVVRSAGSNGLLIRRPCRYIVGDDIKYVQEKLVMFLIDADGTECRAQVMQQE